MSMSLFLFCSLVSFSFSFYSSYCLILSFFIFFISVIFFISLPGLVFCFYHIQAQFSFICPTSTFDLLYLPLVWQTPFGSIASPKVAISYLFKTERQWFYKGNCCQTEKLTSLTSPSNGPLHCIQGASVVYWINTVGATSSTHIGSYSLVISLYFLLYLVLCFRSFLLIW